MFFEYSITQWRNAFFLLDHCDSKNTTIWITFQRTFEEHTNISHRLWKPYQGCQYNGMEWFLIMNQEEIHFCPGYEKSNLLVVVICISFLPHDTMYVIILQFLLSNNWETTMLSQWICKQREINSVLSRDITLNEEVWNNYEIVE